MALVLTARTEKNVEWNKLRRRINTHEKSLCSPEAVSLFVPRRCPGGCPGEFFLGPGECRVFPEKSKFSGSSPGKSPYIPENSPGEF